MDPRSMVKVHFDLHHAQDEIEVTGRHYPVVHEETHSKKFSRVDIDNLRFITQNIRKNSWWTNWVLHDPSRRVTWIVRPEKFKYLGRVQSWTEHGKLHVAVYEFNPEKIVFEASKEL